MSSQPTEQQDFRSKRRTAKVDYTEKKEDFDFDHTKETSKKPATAPPCKDTPPKKKRKQSGCNANKGSSASRSESPVSSPADHQDSSNSIPTNYQPEIKNWRFSNILNLEGAVVRNKLELILKDGTSLKKDDSIYLVCEPPGEPYYIGRIMGFVKKNKHGQEGTMAKDLEESAEDYLFKINWWYRSRDISKHSTDSRLVYASMHSDTCPIPSFRGKCLVKHKDEIDDFEEYKSKPNQFWFEKFFDRYMIKFYDVLSTCSLTSLPINYRTALNKRFQYIFLEQGKAKDMLQQPKSCVKCHQWSASGDSIECCECNEIYHMLCLDPPMVKKPARGFAWSCIKCTKKLESQKMIPNGETSSIEEAAVSNTGATTDHPISKKVPLYEELAIQFLEKDRQNSFDDRRNLEEWNYRYLGMHAKLEDALDVQDRPYPRAASRLGPKNQLTGVRLGWYNHPVVYFDYSELSEEHQGKIPPSLRYHTGRKRKVDGRRKKSKTDVDNDEMFVPLKVPEEYKDVDPTEFPPWLQPRPKGYIERGGDDGLTSELLWKNPQKLDGNDDIEIINLKIDEYVRNCDFIAKGLGLLPTTPNFQDAILKNLMISHYDFEKAMELNSKIDKTSLKEPQFTSSEIKKFEDGVAKYGSELWPTFKEVKSQSFGMIVRFYYLWKKTPNGRQIWGNFADRRKLKSPSTKESTTPKSPELVLSNDQDDSSYDSEKIKDERLSCKHCKTQTSRIWYKSPGLQHLDDIHYALCLRCARLWRRYAVVWEEPYEVYKKISQKGGTGWKRKIEPELAADAELILEAIRDNSNSTPSSEANVSLKNKSGADVPGEESITEIKKSVKEESDESSTLEQTQATPKAKRSYHKQSKDSKDSKSTQQQRIELLVSNVLTHSSTGNNSTTSLSSSSIPTNINIQSAINERCYQITSPYYNTRPKYKEPPCAATSKNSISPSKAKQVQSSPCFVCFQSNNELLNCSNCGIAVHPTCYGVDYDAKLLSTETRSLAEYSWNCDRCSNALNPIISENYECVLCHDESDSRGALKRTSDGRWAHLICAFFADGIKFQDLLSLQPILGTGRYNMTRILKGGNAEYDLLRCNECKKSWKVNELIKDGVCYARVGFQLLELGRDVKPDPRSIRIGSLTGKLEPVLICNDHSAVDNFYGFDFLGKRLKQNNSVTLLRLFLDDQKRPEKLGLCGVSLRYKELSDVLEALKTKAGDVNGSLKEEPIDSTQVERKCTECGINHSIYWKDSLCFKCSMKNNFGLGHDDDSSTARFLKIGPIYTALETDSWKKESKGRRIQKPIEANETYDFGETYDINNVEAFEKWSNEFNPFKKLVKHFFTNGEDKPAVISTEPTGPTLHTFNAPTLPPTPILKTFTASSNAADFKTLGPLNVTISSASTQSHELPNNPDTAVKSPILHANSAETKENEIKVEANTTSSSGESPSGPKQHVKMSIGSILG